MSNPIKAGKVLDFYRFEVMADDREEIREAYFEVTPKPMPYSSILEDLYCKPEAVDRKRAVQQMQAFIESNRRIVADVLQGRVADLLPPKPFPLNKAVVERALQLMADTTLSQSEKDAAEAELAKLKSV